MKHKSHLKAQSKGSTRLKAPDTSKSINYDSSAPIFSFRHMRYGGKYCMSLCERDDKLAIYGTLLTLSQLTWSQIKMRPREKMGFEKIPKEQIKASLPPIITPEVPVLVFRFSDGDTEIRLFEIE